MIHLKPKPFAVLFVTLFVDSLGFGIVIPIFPQLFTPGAADSVLPSTWSASQGYILLGWIAALYPLTQFISTPILGQLSDRYGRKPVLAFSIFGTVVGYILFAVGLYTKNIPLLLGSRILDGFSGGNISVAQAAVADITPTKNLPKNFGIIGVAMGLGFIVGPLIGGLLSGNSSAVLFGALTPFIVAALAAFINLMMVIFLLPETLKLNIKKRLDISRPFRNIYTAFSRPGLRSVMPMNFMFMAGFTLLTTFIGLILASKFGFQPSGIGGYFAYVGICVAIAQGGLTALVAKKWQDYQVLRYSLFIAGASIFGFLFVPVGQFKWILLLTPILAIGYGLTAAFGTSIVSRITPANLQGEALGINASVMALANSVPSFLGGYVALVNSDLTIFLASALMFIGGAMFWLMFKPGRDDNIAIKTD